MKMLTLEETEPGYDVVIVGAGPAGCMAGYFLDKNLKVLVIDTKELPRNKPCGGLLVEESQFFLEKLVPPNCFYVSPKNLDVNYCDWSNNFEKNIKKGFLNIDRRKFDKWLFSLLNRDNISIGTKIKLIDFSPTKDKNYLVLILESNGNIKPIITKYLVGADGALSKIREKVHGKEIRYYIAIQETMKGKEINSAYFIYDDEITDFYSWIIPKGSKIVIGSALRPYKAREKFYLFKKKVEKRFGVKNRGLLDSAIILRPNIESDIFLGKGNVLVAGEAAGLISPSSGEGISFALESGKLCAEAITENPKNPVLAYQHKCLPLIER